MRSKASSARTATRVTASKDGASNKQVAATLVVSVATVEAHLSKIYAKLGVRSRTALAAAWPRNTKDQGSRE